MILLLKMNYYITLHIILFIVYSLIYCLIYYDNEKKVEDKDK